MNYYYHTVALTDSDRAALPARRRWEHYFMHQFSEHQSAVTNDRKTWLRNFSCLSQVLHTIRGRKNKWFGRFPSVNFLESFNVTEIAMNKECVKKSSAKALKERGGEKEENVVHFVVYANSLLAAHKSVSNSIIKLASVNLLRLIWCWRRLLSPRSPRTKSDYTFVFKAKQMNGEKKENIHQIQRKWTEVKKGTIKYGMKESEGASSVRRYKEMIICT